MRTIPAGRFKAQCLKLLDEVAETGAEITVTKRGRPVARVVPVEPAPSLKGSVVYLVPVELDEGPGVEQLLEALAGEELAPFALARHVPLARGMERLLAKLLEPAELRLRRVVRLGHRRGA